jgi:hypothetical protein
MARLFFLLALLLVPSTAEPATITFANGKKKISVNPKAAEPFQKLLDWLEQNGYKVAFARGYGRGTVRHSLHPSGMAIDINQVARNRVTRRYPAGTTEYAASLGIFHGSKWRSGDYGHFQIGGWQGYARAAHKVRVVSASSEAQGGSIAGGVHGTRDHDP